MFQQNMFSLSESLKVFSLLCCLNIVTAVELTFELPDTAKQCFYEEIEKGTSATLEFQVITGGYYDVDATLETLNGAVLYKGIKKESDSYSFVAEETGVHRLCFSNEFSSVSHKLVYMDFFVGEEKPLPGILDHSVAMTKLETSSSNIHKTLNSILDYQTHHRLREAQSRKRAEDLNHRVMYWSIGETLLIIIIGIGEVVILKRFFTEKKSSST